MTLPARTLAHFDAPIYAACLCSGRWLAVVPSADDSRVAVLDSGEDAVVEAPESQELDEDAATVAYIAGHPSCPWIAVSGHGRPIRIWDVEQGRPLAEFGDRNSDFLGLAFSSCGQFLETYDAARARGVRFALESGAIVGERWGDVGDIAVGGELLAVGVGEYERSVYFGRWVGPSMRWYRPALELPVPARVYFGPGVVAAVGGLEAVHLFVHDFPACTARFSLGLGAVGEDTLDVTSPSEALTFAPDAESCFVADGTGEVVEVELRNGEVRRRWRAHDRMIVGLWFHGQTLISVGVDGRVMATSLGPFGDAEQSQTRAALDDFLAVAAVTDTDQPGRSPDDFDIFGAAPE